MELTHDIALIEAARAIVEPDQGSQPVLDLINSAEKTIRLKMFTFTSDDIALALIAAQARGVSVRVMLNPARSSGSRANDDMKARLQAGGCTVIWSSPAFAVTHEKSMVVDSRTAMIATFNFGVKYFTATRDYGILTEDPRVIAEIEACFEADWTRREFTRPETSAPVWSNRGSRTLMCHYIDTATHTLDVQHPKFVDAVVLDRLIQAHERGVRVRVLCGGKHGISTWDILDTFASLRIAKLQGIKIRKQKHLRLHAKLLLADHKTAMVGSMNIDRSAFDLRRELGCFVNDPAAVTILADTFHEDWHEASHYDPPDPLTVELVTEDDQPHDSNSSTSEAIADPVDAEPAKPSASPWDIAVTFNEISLSSFGGGLSAWSREMVVARRKWMDDPEFLSAMTICRILPGANQVNLAVFVGTKLNGIRGAAAALAGLIFMPTVLLMAIAALYAAFQHSHAVQHVLAGFAAAAVAMTLQMVWKTGRTTLTSVVPVLLFALTFALNGVLRWPLWWTLPLTAPLGIAWAWRRAHRRITAQAAAGVAAP